MRVDRSTYFHDSYDGMVVPDTLKVGNNAPVSIVSMQEGRQSGGAYPIITVARPISFASGDPVTLSYSGAMPDVGARESE